MKYMIVPPVRKNKKYSVLIFKDNKWRHLLSFGDSRYQHYKDTTPLKLWSHLDHNDEERRKNYYARHGYTDNMMTAKWFSNTYLWG